MSEMKNAPTVIHGDSQTPEYTLCGLAVDVFESGDHFEPIVLAKNREIVTCEDCRRALDHAKLSFRGYRYVSKAAPKGEEGK